MSTHLPEGYTSLSPLVVVSPASEAVDFYCAVLGARVVTRMDGPDGSVWHCELDLGHGRMTVMDPNPQLHAVANDPRSDDARFSLAVYVPDVDAALALARAHGARVREEAADFAVTGDRYASVQDPYGVRWTLMTRVERRTDEEVQQGLDAWRAALDQPA
ncbi:VOC family protein [Georgenia satyanarayanai]|uniref:VOC family protein n=1 Tax=Georgenia satyanarayanai TaxID=860221 RepID=UPI00203AF59F|nr:VOC family protein [Georgenia satyanarayanai]MCM3659523.1 VOC family protein [Georgenia satyanarayanai]